MGMRSINHKDTVQSLGRTFAHSLIPIALAYVVAHYFSLVALQGQALASLASDPLGNGANIFGTASVRTPEVEFLVETRDREHTEALVALLQANGIKAALT